MLDEHWLRSMHVEALRRGELDGGREPHVLFQASTIGALMDGAYDGDLSFAELAAHGDFGLGTLNGLGGEMVALDGSFYCADLDGNLAPIELTAKTPFAVVAPFDPGLDRQVALRGGQVDLLDTIDELVDDDRLSCAVRVDCRFPMVQLRSVPPQSPPYRPLSEVVAEQHVFELEDVVGTLVGFRFPLFVDEFEMGGYHFHFLDEDRRRGGHLLDCHFEPFRVRVDASSEIRIELPPGIDLSDPLLSAATHEAVQRVENAPPPGGRSPI